jgi:prepilin-type N-terminal cleavage/methylation domain-containing protein
MTLPNELDSTTRTPALRARRGFTLAEVVLAMSLLLVLIGLSTQLFQKQSRSVATQAGRLDAQQNSRFAMSMLDRELRIAGVGVVDAQPLVVQAAPLAITFNADLAALDTGDKSAVYINPDADSAAVDVLRNTTKITLPTSTNQYPDSTYMQNTGVPSNAETISYWLSKDSTSSDTNEYILFRRANARPAKVVAKGIIVSPNDTVFQYFRADSAGTLQAVPTAALPLTHFAAMHGSPADTGKSSLTDSLRQVKVTLTSVYHDPRTGKDVLRRMQSTIHLMNAGLIHRSTCGQPPIAVAVTATLTPADGITVMQSYVTVAWTPSIDDGSGEKDVERYAIYRRLSSATNFDEPLTSVPAGSASYSFVDSDLQSGQSWVYGVAAQDCTPASSAIGTAPAVVIP